MKRVLIPQSIACDFALGCEVSASRVHSSLRDGVFEGEVCLPVGRQVPRRAGNV